MTSRRMWAAMGVLALAAGACSTGGAAREGREASKAEGMGAVTSPEIDLAVGEATVLHPEGARNPTTAIDPNSGAVYAAWAREVPVPEGSDADPLIEAVVARSYDGGATFGSPVVVSPPGMRVVTYTVSPTQVEVGPDGEVYVLFLENQPAELPGHSYGFSFLRLVRSDDGGRSFSAPVDVAPHAREGVEATSMEMANLFVAPDGDVYISFLDFRERITLGLEQQAGNVPVEDDGGHGHGGTETATQLRIVRSTDRGTTFAPSVLVSKPTCECCGTKVAEGRDTPLYATTRSSWLELKGSKDAVRDPFLSVSRDGGSTWSEAVKIHDDKFKISGCPDVNAGLATDSQGRLHAAWYTGSETGPGVYYAVSTDEGATFSEPAALMADEWIPYGDVQMALDEDDRAWVAFEDRRGDVDMIQVVRVDPDGARSYSKAWPGTAPDLASAGGKAVVVWGTLAGANDKSGPVSVAVVTPAAGDGAESTP